MPWLSCTAPRCATVRAPDAPRRRPHCRRHMQLEPPTPSGRFVPNGSSRKARGRMPTTRAPWGGIGTRDCSGPRRMAPRTAGSGKLGRQQCWGQICGNPVNADRAAVGWAGMRWAGRHRLRPDSPPASLAPRDSASAGLGLLEVPCRANRPAAKKLHVESSHNALFHVKLAEISNKHTPGSPQGLLIRPPGSIRRPVPRSSWSANWYCRR